MVYCFLRTAVHDAGVLSRQRHRGVSAPRERRQSMRTWIRMLVLVLGLVVGTAPVALAFGGHGGFHGGGFGHRGFAGGGFGHRRFAGGGFGHRGFAGGGFGHPRFLHGFPGGGFRHFHARHFHSGVFFDVAPLWLAPAPYYVAPAPYI